MNIKHRKKKVMEMTATDWEAGVRFRIMFNKALRVLLFVSSFKNNTFNFLFLCFILYKDFFF